jgi:hypothetical protein
MHVYAYCTIVLVNVLPAGSVIALRTAVTCRLRRADSKTPTIPEISRPERYSGPHVRQPVNTGPWNARGWGRLILKRDRRGDSSANRETIAPSMSARPAMSH